MRTFQTTAHVCEDGTFTARIPLAIPPGDHTVVVTIDVPEPDPPPLRPPNEGDMEGIVGYLDLPGSALDGLPVYDRGPWPENWSLRREDMYDDWGR